MSSKIIVNRETCIGAAPCFAVAPKVFQIDSENKAIVADENGADDKTVLEVAQACPVNAIAIIDRETGKQIYP
jgi:ferredoxin